jgi:hypothetical protein
MRLRITAALLLAGIVPLRAADLGDRDQVAALYAFPNNCISVCFINQTLAETIKVYLDATIRRDGWSGTSVTVSEQAGRIQATFSGPGAATYEVALPAFLAAGAKGLDGARALNAKKGWQYTWRFFLPLGLAMTRHKTVELLHFPPDYGLERDQDYLSAHTTLRWAELLEANGVAKTDTDSYQTIVDIAPIAAPASAGKELEGVYASFRDYIHGLLNLLVPVQGTNAGRPMVAFGGPVRAWIKTEFGKDLKVLDLTVLKLQSGVSVNTLAANHPSLIYNAVKVDDPTTPPDKKLQTAMAIMAQDVVAACWQARMGQAPQSDPAGTLTACKQTWSGRDRDLCVLSQTQVFNKKPDEAKKLCVKVPAGHAKKVSAKQLEAVSKGVAEENAPKKGK